MGKLTEPEGFNFRKAQQMVGLGVFNAFRNLDAVEDVFFGGVEDREKRGRNNRMGFL